MSSLARTERAALCDLLDALGPDQPTLCAPWRTRDLAAHLVLRESRLDALPGIVLPVAAGWTARLQDRLAAGNFAELVERLRTGPPRFSPFRPRRLDEAANGIEFFVHHEDARRAQANWGPRTLNSATEDLLWRRVRTMARAGVRGEGSGEGSGARGQDGGAHSGGGAVALIRAGTTRAYYRALSARRLRAGERVVIVCGTPSELLLYALGRRAHARVITGSAWTSPTRPGSGTAAR